MKVEIYSKANCPLCDDAKAVLLEVRERIPFELVEVDITSSPELFERYRYDIPVVFIDGQKAFKHRLDTQRVAERLQRGTSVAATKDRAR